MGGSGRYRTRQTNCDFFDTIGRATARRTVPKRPRAIRVGPNKGGTKFGGGIPGGLSNTGSLSNYQIPGVYPADRYRGFILRIDTGGLSY